MSALDLTLLAIIGVSTLFGLMRGFIAALSYSRTMRKSISMVFEASALSKREKKYSLRPFARNC